MLENVDLSQTIAPEDYARELDDLQEKAHLLGLELFRQERAAVMVFEGWDAAGKGGTIRRITQRLDPRMYVVWPISAPEGEDKVHHYLYRFWRRLPARGHLAIFDRSWYGRVLVERVEGLATEAEWRRAYGEINAFEKLLVDDGAIILKFWLQISPDEQLHRFQRRLEDPAKRWKMNEEDWRNRGKWQQYEAAVEDMLRHTSTECAPWVVVEGNDKRWARVKVLRTVVERLQRALDAARHVARQDA